MRRESSDAERLVAFSGKRRGVCPNCGAQCMVKSAALVVDQVLPEVSMRERVLSVSFALRLGFACEPEAIAAALGVICRTNAER